MVRSSVILAGALLLTVLFVPLMAPRASAADVPVLLLQRNFLFHIDVNNNANRNIAAAVGDTIRLQVKNNDAVTHTFTAPHFPQDTSPGTTQNLTENFLSVNLTAGSSFFWNYTVTTGDQGMWQFYCKPHSSGTYPFRSGMIGFFYLGAPTVQITSPATGATVSTLGFRLTVQVQTFTLDAENVGLPNITGHGHIHFFVDGTYVGLSPSPVFDFGALSTGSHVIRAELFTNNHWALPTPVFQQINVIAGPPELTVGAATVSSLGFRVRIAVRNFTLDELGYGGPNVPGQGHWHVNDGPVLLAAVATESAPIGAQAVGSLTLNVSLHNNDHSPLATPVYRLITVQVANPSIALSAPPSIETGKDLTITWTVGGFVLDNAAFGGAPEVGRGHVHVFEIVGGQEVLKGQTAGTSWTFTGLSAGAHTFKVELYNNDHSELATEYSSTVNVTVSAPPEAGISTPIFYGSLIVLIIIVVALAAMLMRMRMRSGGPKTPPEQP